MAALGTDVVDTSSFSGRQSERISAGGSGSRSVQLSERDAGEESISLSCVRLVGTAAAAGGAVVPEAASALPLSAAALPDPMTAHFHAYYKRDPYMLLHKAVYFLGMGAAASYYPFLVLYLRSIGIESEFHAGLIMAAAHTASTLAAPLITRIADRSPRNRRLVLTLSFSSAILAALFMFFARSLPAVIAGAIAIDVVLAGTWPTMDASVIALLSATQAGGDTSRYSETRAFGAAGWGLWAWACGSICE